MKIAPSLAKYAHSLKDEHHTTLSLDHKRKLLDLGVLSTYGKTFSYQGNLGALIIGKRGVVRLCSAICQLDDCTRLASDSPLVYFDGSRSLVFDQRKSSGQYLAPFMSTKNYLNGQTACALSDIIIFADAENKNIYEGHAWDAAVELANTHRLYYNPDKILKFADTTRVTIIARPRVESQSAQTHGRNTENITDEYPALARAVHELLFTGKISKNCEWYTM